MKTTVLVLTLVCVYLSSLHYCKSPEPEYTYPEEQKKADIALMKKHGVDVLMVKWDNSVWIKRDGKMIKVK